MKRILFIVGSTRTGSFNQQLAQAAAACLADRAETSFLDYADVPFISQDIEFPAPAAVVRVREEIARADGLWIVSPEYNHSYPGALKNLIDWASRPVVKNDYASGTAIRGKKATLCGVAGKSAAADVMDNLEALLKQVRADVMESPRTGIALAGPAFEAEKLVLSEDEKNALAAQANAFLSFVS